MSKFEMKRQEQLYLDHIIWLWSEYDRLMKQLSSETNGGKHGLYLRGLILFTMSTGVPMLTTDTGHHCTYSQAFTLSGGEEMTTET